MSCPPRARNHLSPEDSKFATRMTQPLAQQPDTSVAQGVVGQIKLCQGLVDPQGGRKIFRGFGSEATTVQPVIEDEREKKKKVEKIIMSYFWKVFFS